LQEVRLSNGSNIGIFYIRTMSFISTVEDVSSVFLPFPLISPGTSPRSWRFSYHISDCGNFRKSSDV